MNDSFLLSLQGPIAHLQLNRPERANTLSPDFCVALRDAVRGLQDGGLVRVLVISSTGAHFSAGLSLDESVGDLRPSRGSRADRRDPRESAAREAIGAIMEMLDDRPGAPPGAPADLSRLLECFDTLESAPFPVICAVQGGCVGAALDLACACDIRLCTADAFFAPDESEPGMGVDLAVLQRLRRVIAPGALRELAYTGERLDADRARALGLVNAVLPDAVALLRHALALAGRIAAKSPLVVAGAKAALRSPPDEARVSIAKA